MEIVDGWMCAIFPLKSDSLSLTFHVRAEVVADLFEDEVDVLLGGNGVGGDVGGRVGGPGDGHLLPWQEEDDSPITGGGVQKAHVVRAGWGSRVRGGGGVPPGF